MGFNVNGKRDFATLATFFLANKFCLPHISISIGLLPFLQLSKCNISNAWVSKTKKHLSMMLINQKTLAGQI